MDEPFHPEKLKRLLCSVIFTKKHLQSESERPIKAGTSVHPSQSSWPFGCAIYWPVEQPTATTVGDNPIGGITAKLTCIKCGHPVRMVNVGRVIAGNEASAIVGCSNCRAQWHFRVTLTQIADRKVDLDNEPNGCGSEAGYAMHRRKGTPSCDECRKAHARSQAERRQRVSA